MAEYPVLPLASFALVVKPGRLVPPVSPDFPVSVRLTMAAIDPYKPLDNENLPSTLRIVKLPEMDESDDEDSDSFSGEGNGDARIVEDDSSDDDEAEEDDEEEASNEESGEDSSEDEDGETYESVLCTLSPTTGFQQVLDIVLTPHEPIAFQVTGSYAVHVTGNYIEHPYDEPSDSEGEDGEYSDDEEQDSEEEESGDDLDDLSAEEAMSEDDDEEEDSEEDSDLQEKIRELVDEPAKSKKAGKADVKQDKAAAKRAAEAEQKQQKKQKTEAGQKHVEFSKKLEKGPGATDSKFTTRKLEGGVVVEDRKVGEGPTVKRGSTVGIRYVGKLKNGKVFDKNVSGGPFKFCVGKAEVIRGLEIGVAGMAVKGERRVIIPAHLAYGTQSLPGIPKNSELTFDVKLISLK